MASSTSERSAATPAQRHLAAMVRSDLVRFRAAGSTRQSIVCYLRQPTFRAVFWYRVCSAWQGRTGYHRALYLAARLAQRRTEFRHGISLPPGATIGPGLLISHPGGIVVNEAVVIGANCNLAHDVTIGKSHRGGKAGTPIIGDRVYIGPGARIIGAITIGHDAAIGANAVVVDDVAPMSVVAAPMAAVVSMNGSAGMVNNQA